MGGKLSLSVAPVSLAFVISSAIETVHLAAEAKNIQLIAVLDTAVDRVFGDSGRLQQVVWNLLSNAVKFTPNGGQVTIRLTQVDENAQIETIDTGKGINPEFLPYIFEYFRQEDASTTRKFGGLGLGLAIARQIVEMHGGKIWADSQGIDRGATFTVCIPLFKDTKSAPQTAVSPNSGKVDRAPLTGIRALIVDDDSDSREFVAFLLQESGAVVRAAASASEALQSLKQALPDILLSDIGMPGMDGYTLIATVRSLQQYETLPAIALTAYASDNDKQRAIAAGFQNHIPKPIDPTQLIAAILQLAQRQSKRSH
jgi:CheY-like chemotaxis protein